jgi:hypothetical protein
LTLSTMGSSDGSSVAWSPGWPGADRCAGGRSAPEAPRAVTRTCWRGLGPLSGTCGNRSPLGSVVGAPICSLVEGAMPLPCVGKFGEGALASVGTFGEGGAEDWPGSGSFDGGGSSDGGRTKTMPPSLGALVGLTVGNSGVGTKSPPADGTTGAMGAGATSATASVGAEMMGGCARPTPASGEPALGPYSTAAPLR